MFYSSYNMQQNPITTTIKLAIKWAVSCPRSLSIVAAQRLFANNCDCILSKFHYITDIQTQLRKFRTKFNLPPYQSVKILPIISIPPILDPFAAMQPPAMDGKLAIFRDKKSKEQKIVIFSQAYIRYAYIGKLQA